MAEINKYLTPSDFSSRIGGVSASLTQSEIQPYWVQFRENQLEHLLPDTHAFWTWWQAEPQLTDAEKTKLDEALRRWAVYAIWAYYILQGDAQQTKSGLTVKKTDESAPLDSRQRAELYRRYADMAYRHEGTVRTLLATDTDCTVTRRRSRRIRVVGTNRNDYF
ncbi:hypothetical protein A6C57_01190 [Fibrella sp. ES10-3-2-2]|nr:hypothetical protein A6C57_01190 [Fibrella sp. ES10-3-2-2]